MKNIAILFLLITFCAEAQTTRECITTQYLSCVGVREATGNNDGIDVEKYLASVGLGKGYPWCAAFVNYNLKACNASSASSAWSPAWFPESKIILTRGWFVNAGTLPQPGDVFGIYFPDKKRIAHVGFIHEWKGNSAVTVEGNTNGAGSREGNGVYKKIRLTKQIFAVSNWIDK